MVGYIYIRKNIFKRKCHSTISADLPFIIFNAAMFAVFNNFFSDSYFKFYRHRSLIQKNKCTSKINN